MNVKIPWTFTVVVVLIMIWVVYTAGVWSGLIDAGTDAPLVAAFVTGWIGVLVFAILGAFLLGMYAGHRILSMGDFTPFEEEMLHMKEDVAQMRAELKTLREGVGARSNGAVEAKKGESADKGEKK